MSDKSEPEHEPRSKLYVVRLIDPMITDRYIGAILYEAETTPRYSPYLQDEGLLEPEYEYLKEKYSPLQVNISSVQTLEDYKKGLWDGAHLSVYVRHQIFLLLAERVNSAPTSDQITLWVSAEESGDGVWRRARFEELTIKRGRPAPTPRGLRQWLEELPALGRDLLLVLALAAGVILGASVR